MLLDFLRPKMNVSDDEAFSVYPGKSNNPGDIIKGRTFRRLNVTRKIVIKDVPELIRSALNMQTFALGQKCVRQSRGSPMGSPLSPALCLILVSIFNKFGLVLSTNSSPIIICSFDTSDMLIIVSYLVTSASLHLHHMKSSWTKDSTENPSFSRRNLTKNFLASCLKQNLWSWSTRDRPIPLKSSHLFQLPLQKSSSVAFAHAVTSSSRVPSLLFVFDKVWPN